MFFKSPRHNFDGTYHSYALFSGPQILYLIWRIWCHIIYLIPLSAQNIRNWMAGYFLSKVTGKDLNENSHGLMYGTVPVFLWGAECKNENHQDNRSVACVLYPVPSENKIIEEL
jgi:hypothetical protein